MLNVSSYSIMLGVIIPNVTMVKVVAPAKDWEFKWDWIFSMVSFLMETGNNVIKLFAS